MKIDLAAEYGDDIIDFIIHVSDHSARQQSFQYQLSCHDESDLSQDLKLYILWVLRNPKNINKQTIKPFIAKISRDQSKIIMAKHYKKKKRVIVENIDHYDIPARDDHTRDIPRYLVLLSEGINDDHVAMLMGISRSTLSRLKKKYING